ncbi:MAG TPA: hypothetical protein PLV87_05580, partial [Opitutaceae bacterium]|nr:hypothetical protein [Opitutaceae bacterium]
MKTYLLPACALLLCLVMTGCESVRSDLSAGVREKIHGPVFQTRVFAGTQRDVFEAARASVAGMGFKITRSGPAQGVIEAFNALSTGETLKTTQQLRLQVRISPVAEGCEVAALFTQMLENDFNKGRGQATENAVKNTSLYDVLFGRIAG